MPTMAVAIPATPDRSAGRPTPGPTLHLALAVQVFPEHAADTAKLAAISASQDARLPVTLTYCPPQNRAPCGWEHAVWHPPVMLASHEVRQSRFTCTVHEALQLVWHISVHVMDAGWTSRHWTAQRLSHDAWQSVVQLLSVQFVSQPA
jgi:hypothetical protein